MTVVYTPTSQINLSDALSPRRMVRNLWRHRELTATIAARDFSAAYRSTFLGAAWTILTPLILLALFTFVFGYIFNGRFSHSVSESPADFALALFVGLSLYLCVGTALTSSASLMLGNAPYVKSLAFPVEVLPVAQVLVLMLNLSISLGLCLVASLFLKGFVHWTAIFVLVHMACVMLLALGLYWFLSALAVFVRDVPSVTAPLGMVLMYVSGVFFPLDSLPHRLQAVFRLNPLAVIIDQARGALLYGTVPSLPPLAVVTVISGVVAMLGYVFFMRSKPAFSDVL